MSKALVRGLAVAATLVVACSSPPDSNPTATGSGATAPAGKTGTVHLQFTLPSGQSVSAVDYAITNGTNTYTGTVNVAASASAGFAVGGVVSGSGYTLTLTEVTTDNAISCGGTSAPFDVTAGSAIGVTVQLVCTTNSDDAGTIIVTPVVNECPTWNTILADPSSLSTTPPGNTSLISASASAPDTTQLTYTWAVTTGAGTLSGQSAQGTTNSTITFTCPTTSESDVITVVASDQTGAECPTADTTATVTIVCNAADGGLPQATPGFNVAAGGTYGASQNFTLVSRVGQNPGGSNLGSSANFVLKAGIVSVTQPN